MPAYQTAGAAGLDLCACPEDGLPSVVEPGMRALVERHRAQGDLCAIVTATSRWVAEPFARGFGIGEQGPR